MSERGVVEAALFSAGKPLAVDEIAGTTGLPADAVRPALAALAQGYEEAGSSIEVLRIGEKWTMQIRASYGENAHAFIPPELPKDLLKTSALIAYHQPVKQSDLVRMVGSKAYEHVKALTDHGLITTRPTGQTLELRTSASFPEFFGLPASDREEMKRLLAERIGAPPPTPVSPRETPPTLRPTPEEPNAP
jgi:segregation and condensation protein B